MPARKDVYHPSSYTAPSGSWASSEPIRRTMLRNRSTNTIPERALRSAVHAAGLRYRLWLRPIPAVRRTADMVFSKARVAVFLDGCFWHACPDHFVPPKTNAPYWNVKIAGNKRRDAATDEALSAGGWTVIRVWEHEDPATAAARIADAVRAT